MSTALIISGIVIFLVGATIGVFSAVRHKFVRLYAIPAGVGLILLTIGVIMPAPLPDASTLALSLNELPADWKIYSEGITAEGPYTGYFERVFVTERTHQGLPLIDQILVCRIKVLPSAAEAQGEYDSHVTQAENEEFSCEDVSFGDECFAYEAIGYGFCSVIREKNVVGVVQMSTRLYGGSLDMVKEYAGKLESKIY